MGKLVKQMRTQDWLLILLSTGFIVWQVYLDLRLPDYMAEITRLTQTEGSAMQDILLAGGMMLLCALGSLLTSVIVGFFAAKVAASFAMRLRALMFERVEAFSTEELAAFSTPSLINRTTNDITQMQLLFAIGLQVAVKAPIMAVWAIFKIAGKNLQWTMATGIALAVLLCMVGSILIVVIPRFKKIQTLTDNLGRIARENLTGIRVVRAYHAEQYQNDKFEGANEALTSNNLSANRAMAIMHPGMGFVMNVLNLSIYSIGAGLIAAAGMADKLVLFSNMVVFLSYAMLVLMSFLMLTMILVQFPRAQVSANRIREVLNTLPKIKDGTETEGMEQLRGEVEFKNVSFHYPDAEEAILQNISFTAHKGQTIAFIGSTGSGKSTLLNLIPRFYDATEGEVFIDGVNVRSYTLEALYDKIGYVSQRAILFGGTVRSNVIYGENGRDNDEEEAVLQNALHIAQAADFVAQMDGGAEAAIAQGGANVSGGQKQRLAIARAIARQPELYLFDDSFSALDYKTDRVLRSALQKATKDATVFIVAQRIGTIRDADQIIVLEDGKMVGCGTHDDLMRDCDTYRQIAYSQLSKEELA